MRISLDPGLDTGWAIWLSEKLLACGLGDPRLSSECDATSLSDVVIESQAIYPGTKRPNDIVTLAQCAGRWAGRFDVYAPSACVRFVSVREWKGNVPKAVMHDRIYDRLSSEELMILGDACGSVAPSKQHNVLDAVGLGLYAIGRGKR